MARHEAKVNRSVVFRTAWGWMGLAASELGVCLIVLPRPSRRAVESELSTREAALVRKGWKGDKGDRVAGSRRQPQTSLSSRLPERALQVARRQIAEYVRGTRHHLDFPVDLTAGTGFQRRVWRAIRLIPYGRLRSYKWVAMRMGGARYARAVGHALGANPVPVIVPCHRVVSHDASLGGFSGGLRNKRRFLRLEGTFVYLRQYVRPS